MKWLAAIALGFALMIGAAPTRAATPPSQLMEARLKQAREARKPTSADLKVTIVADGVTEYTASATLVSNSPVTLKSTDGKKLVVGGDDGIGAMLGWLLLDSAVVKAITGLGDFRPANTGVEVLSDAFGYRYGTEPSLVVSRDLSRVLNVEWTASGIDYSARFAFDGDADWPNTLTVLRNGRPWVRMTISAKTAD